jgi:hypothetical protein
MVLAQPTAVDGTTALAAEICGINCNWGFGIGAVILIVGPLPGPT